MRFGGLRLAASLGQSRHRNALPALSAPTGRRLAGSRSIRPWRARATRAAPVSCGARAVMVLPPAAGPRTAACWTDSINSTRSGRKMPLPGKSMPAAHEAGPTPPDSTAARTFAKSLRRSNMAPRFAHPASRIEYGISIDRRGRHNLRSRREMPVQDQRQLGVEPCPASAVFHSIPWSQNGYRQEACPRALFRQRSPLPDRIWNPIDCHLFAAPSIVAHRGVQYSLENLLIYNGLTASKRAGLEPDPCSLRVSGFGAISCVGRIPLH